MRILVVTNLYPTDRNPTWGTFVEQQVQGLRRIGMEIDVLLVDRLVNGKGAYFGLKKVVLPRIEEFCPDLVHVMYGGVMAEAITRVMNGIPVVVSFCGTDLLGGPFFNPLRRAALRLGVFASHLAAKRANGIIVKSKNLMDALPRSVNSSKVWLIPNGVDLNRFQPLEKVGSRQKLGWHSNKYHVLIPASSGHIRKRLWLGQGAVEKLNAKGIAVELHQLHGVAHTDVPVWINASDAVILTSIHEGSPNVVKEALACNRPVVSVDVGDVSERIEGIDGCYLVSPNPEDLAEKLQLALECTSPVEGRIKINELSLERVTQRLYEVYSTLLNQGKSDYDCASNT